MGWTERRKVSGTACDRGVLAAMKGKALKMAARAAEMYGLEAGGRNVAACWFVTQMGGIEKDIRGLPHNG